MNERHAALAGDTRGVRGEPMSKRKIATRKLQSKDVLSDTFTVGVLADQLAGDQHLVAVRAVEAGLADDQSQFNELGPAVRRMGFAIQLLDRFPRTARVSALLDG